MDPKDNFTLAQFLEKRPKGAPPEAAIRGACGRAYYCAFASVRECLLKAKFVVPKDAQAHSLIIRLLKSSTDTSVQGAGGVLDQLRVTRNSADYDVGSIKPAGTPFIPYRAQVAIAQASTVIAAVNGATKNDPRLGIP